MYLNILLFRGAVLKSTVYRILNICVRTERGTGGGHGLQKVDKRGGVGWGGGGLKKPQDCAGIIYRWPQRFVTLYPSFFISNNYSCAS